MAGKGSSQRGDGAERQIVETDESRAEQRKESTGLFVHEIPQTSDAKGDEWAVWWEGRQKLSKHGEGGDGNVEVMERMKG